MPYTALRNRIVAYCEQQHISGALRASRQGEIVYEQTIGYADWENRIPFTKDSMFTLYSLSKPFCAIGLLKLKDKGLVDLDRHPSAYVPEAAGFDERVTVRHLLHHISGLPDFEQTPGFADAYAPGYAENARAHLKALTDFPAFFAPGTAARYENVNFVLCALIIENVSGLPYAEYMQREIFDPLGMQTAVVDNERLTIPHRVKGYIWENDALCTVDKAHDWMLGAGDIVATVDDVYRLNLAIKHGLLLTADTWHEALTPSPLNNMGMGCTITTWHGKRRITHNGGHRGFRTLHVQLTAEDFDIILLSNCGFGNARDDIADMVHAAFYSTDGESQRIEMDTGYI